MKKVSVPLYDTVKLRNVSYPSPEPVLFKEGKQVKQFKVTYVRAAFGTVTAEVTAVNKQQAAEVAWDHLPTLPAAYTDQPELAAYEIEKIEEVKCKKSS